MVQDNIQGTITRNRRYRSAGRLLSPRSWLCPVAITKYSAIKVISIEEVRWKSLTSWSAASARSAACSRSGCWPLPVPDSKCPLARGYRSRVAAPRPAAGSCCARWMRRGRSRSSDAPLLRSSFPWSMEGDVVRSSGSTAKSTNAESSIALIARTILPRIYPHRGGEKPLESVTLSKCLRHIFSRASPLLLSSAASLLSYSWNREMLPRRNCRNRNPIDTDTLNPPCA